MSIEFFFFKFQKFFNSIKHLRKLEFLIKQLILHCKVSSQLGLVLNRKFLIIFLDDLCCPRCLLVYLIIMILKCLPIPQYSSNQLFCWICSTSDAVVDLCTILTLYCIVFNVSTSVLSDFVSLFKIRIFAVFNALKKLI